MALIQRMDHVGITVRDLDTAVTFFLGLGLELDGRTFIEGEFLETVTGIPDARTEIAMLRAPDGGAVELSRFVRPESPGGSPTALANEVGIRTIAFEVEDVDAAVERAASLGCGLVGGIGDFADWRMAYIRGPEGIVVALAQRLSADSISG